MSLSQELKEFAAGLKTGTDIVDTMANTKYREAATRHISPPQEGDLQPGPLDSPGGGTVTIGEGGDEKTGGTGGNTATSGRSGQATGKTSEIAARLKADLMRDFGISDVAAGGIIASLAAESGGFNTLQEINPTVKNSRGGYGYAQWTGPRRVEFEKFAADNKLDINSYEANYGNLKRELKGPEGAILKQLANAKDYREATQIFTGSAASRSGFLRPGTPNMAGRFAWADKIGNVKPFEGGDSIAADETAPAAADTAAPAAEEPALPEPEETASATDTRYSPEPGITVPGVDTSIQTAELGALPGFDDTLFAAQGGAIPEPRFADGGTTDNDFGWGTLLDNNQASTLAGNTAAAPAATNATTTPAASSDFGSFDIGFNRDAPAADTPVATPVQQASLATAAPNPVTVAGNQAAADTVAANAAAAAAAALDPYNAARDATQTPAAQVTATPLIKKPVVKPVVKKPVAKPVYKEPLYSPDPKVNLVDTDVLIPQRVAIEMARGSEGGRTGKTRAQQSNAQRILQKAQRGGMQSLSPQEKAVLRAQGFTRTVKRPDPNQRYEQGGAIPDPQESSGFMFAKGGSVLGGYWQPRAASAAKGSDARFQELLRQEERSSGAGSQGGSARDRAARRFNREVGKKHSTAYTPGGGKKAAPGAPIKETPVKPKTGGGGGWTNPDRTKDDRVIKEPRTKDDYVGPTPVAPNLVRPEVIGDNDPRKKPGLKPGEVPANVGAGGTPPPAIPEPPLVGDPNAPSRAVPTYPQPDKDRTPQQPRPTTTQSPDPLGLDTGTSERFRDPNAPVIEEPPEPDASVLPSRAVPTYPQPDKNRVVVTPPVAAPAPAIEPTRSIAPPIVPEQIDLRPAPITRDDVQELYDSETVVTPGESADPIALARQMLNKGSDPNEIADMLRKAGVPQNRWPPGIAQEGQGEGNFYGFAEGGAIPEPGERGYNEMVAQDRGTAEPERESLQPTPKLRNDVAVGLDGGINYLKRLFGLGGEGAVPTPDDPAIADQGAKRLAMGEGAADPAQIQEVDQAIDPDNRLDEAGKTMTRMAQVTQWYLSQGRKEEAESAAGSMIQASAVKFGRIGSMAQAAYQEYQQSGDPEDLAAVGKYLQKAYDLIPDGANINITVDPETHTLQTTRTNADGEEEQIDLKPQDLPGLIEQAQNKSYYWKEIMKLADPKGYEHKLTSERQAADDARARSEWDRQHGITQGDLTAKEERDAKAAAATEKEKRGYEETESDRKAARDAKIAEDAALRQAAIAAAKGGDTSENERVAAKVGPLMPAFSAAQAAFTKDPSDANKQARDQAASAVYEASGFDAAWMEQNGLPVEEFTFVGQPPVPGGVQMLDPETNQPGWFVPDPNRPGKFMRAKPKATAAPAEPVS